MKKILLLVIAIIKLGQIFSQTPNMLRYQGVARSSNYSVLANSNIKLRFTIRDGSANGVPVYTEIRSATTDSRGSFVCFIGGSGASGQSGSLGAINWTNTTKFLQVELDPFNGVNYTNLGAQQMGVNPYVKLADMAGGLLPGSSIPLNSVNPSGATEGQLMQFNGTQWLPVYLGTSYFTLPYSGSANTTLEIFTLTNSGNSVPMVIDGMQEGLRVTTANGTAIQATSAGPITMFGKNNSNGVGIDATATGTLGPVVKTENTADGVALKVFGNVKISGGNTNPQNGAVLMGDAEGNAVWKFYRSAFHATNQSATSLGAKSGSMKLQMYTETFDVSNNYSTTGDSKFTAPANGIYHFFGDALVSAYHIGTFYDTPELHSATLELRVFRNGTKINSYTHEIKKGDRLFSFLQPRIYTDMYLRAGDTVDLMIKASARNVNPVITFSNFSGKLQIPEF